MDRARIFVSAGIGVALAALGWLLPASFGAANLSVDMLSRSAGVALLGLGLVAAGLAFRAAMRAEQKPTSATTRPQASEYRRGFANRVIGAKRQPVQRGAIVALRRSLRAQTPAGTESGTTLAAAEIERLENMLLNRTAERARRWSMHRDADQHGLAPR
jgi:hypothetical protein